jgi:hypothetical protein
MNHRTLITIGLVACGAASARAQVPGLPVINNGASTGINVGAEIGFPNADYGKGTAIGAHASIGIGLIGVTAMVSRWAPEFGDAIVAPGASATLRLLGGPLVPFRITAQAGASRWSQSSATYLHVPISIGLSATIPNPAFAIKPWIAPRVDMMHTSADASGSLSGTPTSDTQFKFGISGGVDLALLSGITIRAAYDRLSRDTMHPSVFSLGLGFAP